MLHKAIKALPDPVGIEWGWIMTSDRYNRTLNYLTLIVDTLNGPDAAGLGIQGVSILQLNNVHNDGGVHLKFLLVRR